MTDMRAERPTQSNIVGSFIKGLDLETRLLTSDANATDHETKDG
jgi:hypothetical protein